MDGPLGPWYFSTVPRGGPSPLLTPRRVDFHRTKYGPELLVDAAFVRDMPTFEVSRQPHVLSFYDLVLVTRGRGTFALGADLHRVRPGVAFFTRPGDVRQWRVRGLDGACLFFTAEFVEEAFRDPRFLDQFPYFRADRPGGRLALTAAQRRRFLARFRDMTREIAALRTDSSHALRAALYETLVLLGRWYAARHRAAPRPVPSPLVDRFRSLVERDFRHRHRVADYARELGVSPGHLGTLCRASLRGSAGAWIRRRLAFEARQLLLYSDLTAAEVADRLGFVDPAYFARFFRREAGAAPTRFRSARRSAV